MPPETLMIQPVKRDSMSATAELDIIYLPSEDVVAREIEGELIIVPLTADVGDMDDEIYTLNTVGRAIWERLDGKRNLHQVVKELTASYDAPADEIEKDVLGFTGELLKRRMIVAAASG